MTVPKSIPRSRKISERMCDFQGSPNNSSATSSYGEHTGQMAQSLSRSIQADTVLKGSPRTTVCKFFRSGRCTNGDACPFLHGSPQVQQQDGLCKFHLKGTCKFGAKCANKHILSEIGLNRRLIPRLPSPVSTKDPAAPVEVRNKSLPDIFRYSGDSKGQDLFYSTSFHDDALMFVDFPASYGPSRTTPIAEIRMRSASMSHSRAKTPDPFSPFPEDFAEDDEVAELTTFAMDSFNENGEVMEKLCPYAMNSTCRFGHKCHYLHGLKCPVCERNCLHPTDKKKQNDHVHMCREISDLQKINCLMCHEVIYGRSKFGLLFCDHPFCLSCIRSWRAQTLNSGMDADRVLSCPVCHALSPFVTPSTDFIRDPAQKKAVIEEYRVKISTVPCKFDNACPFGRHCFYAHTRTINVDIHDDRFRIVNTNEKTMKVLPSVKLADFFKTTK